MAGEEIELLSDEVITDYNLLTLSPQDQMRFVERAKRGGVCTILGPRVAGTPACEDFLDIASPLLEVRNHSKITLLQLLLSSYVILVLFFLLGICAS